MMQKKTPREYIVSSLDDIKFLVSPLKVSYKRRTAAVSEFYNSYFAETYSILFYFIATIAIVSIILVSISYFAAEQRPDIEKMKGYECGFDPFSDARNPYSVKFFFVAVLFILFDIELLFFHARILAIQYTNLVGFALFFMFYIILVILYIFEWIHDCLDW